jgi:hypothetical protein
MGRLNTESAHYSSFRNMSSRLISKIFKIKIYKTVISPVVLNGCENRSLSRTALGPTQLPIQRVPGALSLGIKRPRLEADHLHPSSAEVKNLWSYTSPPSIRLHGVVLS